MSKHAMKDTMIMTALMLLFLLMVSFACYRYDRTNDRLRKENMSLRFENHELKCVINGQGRTP